MLLYDIFDCVPELTGENRGKEYLTQADRKSIADKGNLKVAPAKSESGCREILFGEQRKSKCEGGEIRLALIFVCRVFKYRYTKYSHQGEAEKRVGYKLSHSIIKSFLH